LKKGEIWEVDLNPVKGSEQAGKRPVLIVSGDLLNTYAKVVWICPLTTKIKNYAGNIILKPSLQNGLKHKSEVLNLHLRAVSKARLVNKIGLVGKAELEIVRKGINEILAMD